MDFINITEREEKELKKIQKLVNSFLKKRDCNIGTVCYDKRLLHHSVIVENDGLLARDISYMIGGTDHADIVDWEDVSGVYDWASDTYIRPYSVVYFKF